MHRTLKNNIKQTLYVVNFHRRYWGVSMFMFMRPPKTRYIYFTIKDKTSWFTRRSCNQQHQRINRIINHIFVHLMTKSQQDQIIWKVLKKPQQVPNLPNMQHGCRTRSISDPTGGGQFPHSVVMVKMHENIASSIRLATFEFHSTYLITGSWWIVLIVHSIIFASASSFGVTANTVTPHFSAREDGRWGVLHAMIAQHAQIDFPQYVLQANPVC